MDAQLFAQYFAEYLNNDFLNLVDSHEMMFLFSDERMVLRCSKNCKDF